MMAIGKIRSRSLKESLEIALLLLAVLSGWLTTHAAQVTLAWDPNSEPDVAGYRLYYGTPAGTFDTVIDVGNVTNYTVVDLQEGATYSFYVTCYNTSNLESDPSNVVEYAVPVGPTGSPVQSTLRSTPSGLVMEMRWATEAGATYRVLYKDNLGDSAWSVLEEFQSAGTSAYYPVTLSGAGARHRFYRVERVP